VFSESLIEQQSFKSGFKNTRGESLMETVLGEVANKTTDRQTTASENIHSLAEAGHQINAMSW